jgi:hypothetical protein
MQIALQSTWTDLLAGHWVIGGILSSLVWFFAGRQSLSNNSVDSAIGWQSGAVITILIVCTWTVIKGEWLGFVCGLAVLYFEILSIRRILTSQNRQK